MVKQRQNAHQNHQVCLLSYRCTFRRAQQPVWQVLRSCVVSLKRRNARGDDCTAVHQVLSRHSAIHAEHHADSDRMVHAAPVAPHCTHAPQSQHAIYVS